MRKFTKITSLCSSIPLENIDTDQIIPARFLKITNKKGLGKYLFHDNPHFHDLIGESQKILVAGNNFGCGSSREHAVWALQDFGFEAVISSSFGDIFYNNSLKNGLLPVILKPFELNQLFRIIEEKPKTKIIVDLENQKITIGNKVFGFPIDTFRRTCLLKEVDELGYILSFEKKIKNFEKSHRIFISA